MVPQAIRLTSIHPALHVYTFWFQIGFEDQAGYGSGAASDDAGSQYEGSGTKSGFPNYADRCGQGCQGEPVQEVSTVLSREKWRGKVLKEVLTQKSPQTKSPQKSAQTIMPIGVVRVVRESLCRRWVGKR